MALHTDTPDDGCPVTETFLQQQDRFLNKSQELLGRVRQVGRSIEERVRTVVTGEARPGDSTTACVRKA